MVRHVNKANNNNNTSPLLQGLKGSAVLVTGSTRGIGRAIAETLILSEATVGINGRDPDVVQAVCASLPGLPKQKIPLPMDLSNPENAADLVKLFFQRAGRIDGLVNNVGSGKAKPFRALTIPDWQKTFHLNIESAMTASREAYLQMRSAQHGSIVNVASISAHGPGKWMGADYAASKAALVSLTKSLAFEAARLNIRVNAVSPGFIETEMTASLTDEMKQRLAIPMLRMGLPSEVASAVIWLLSDLSSYITGQVIHVDGGLWTKG